MICDADSILYATAFAMKDESLSSAINKVDDFLTSISNSCSAEKLLVCISEGKSWRKQYAKTKEYKGNRKDREIPLYLNDLRAHLKDKWKAFYVQHWEADDLIFIARTVYQERFPDYKIFMATNDKDCLQFPGNFVDYKKMMFFTVAPDMAAKNLWTQMVVGDSTDNIAGIKGIGKVGAEKMLKDASPDSYSSIVFKSYVFTYGDHEGIDKFYESYKLLKLVDNCREAGFGPETVPDPITVNYEFARISESSSENSPAPLF
mgnify:CR=1 FL=1